jgi:hypothetical protein
VNRVRYVHLSTPENGKLPDSSLPPSELLPGHEYVHAEAV